jgi:hypothetical protein
MFTTIVAGVVPPEIQNLSQWLLWRRVTKKGKTFKVPITCQGYPAGVDNPRTWSVFDHALEVLTKHPTFATGLGFVFVAGGGLCGIDLDNIWRHEADEGPAWVWTILNTFQDTYSEASPSGTGLKIWCRGTAPHCGKWELGEGYRIEVYDRSRFFAFTGQAGPSRVLTDHQTDLNDLVNGLDRKFSKKDKPGLVVSSLPEGGLIEEGKRHTALISLAGSLFRRQVGIESIKACLRSVNRLQCKPPHSEEHIDELVDSIRWVR